MCTRQSVLCSPFILLVVFASSCVRLFGGEQGDTGETKITAPYVEPKAAWVWDGQEYREASRSEINDAIDKMAHDQHGHGRTFAAPLGSVSGIPVVDLVCPSCGEGKLSLNLISEYYPFGSDPKNGNGPPVYRTYGTCDKCGHSHYIKGTERPAPPLQSERVGGTIVYPLPAGGWFMPRLPAGFRLPGLRPVIPEFALP